MSQSRGHRVLVWIGRLTELSGYGSASRAYVQACRDAGIPTLAVDSVTGEVAGPSTGLPLRIEPIGGGGVRIAAGDGDTRMLAVMHETPPHRDRVTATGRARLCGYAVFETDSLPQAWLDHLLDYDEVWTASDFNVRTFAGAGVPPFLLRAVPHAIDPALNEGVEPMQLPGVRGTVLLAVLSAFNRKDAGGLLRAYRAAFDAGDDVTLVLKLRSQASDAQIEEHVWSKARPEFDREDASAPHVMLLREDLSDERMWALMRRADALVTLERGRGWDLPTMEAMALGTPVVSLGWGGSESFVTPETALVVEASESLVSTDASLVEGHAMYAGHRWATFRPSGAAAALRRIVDEPGLRGRLVDAGRDRVRAIADGPVVAQQIARVLASLNDGDWRGHRPAELVVMPPGMQARPPSQGDAVIGDFPPDRPPMDRPPHTPEATRLLAHLRQVKGTPFWRAREKLARIESMMAAYHSAKGTVHPEHPVAEAFEAFARVPRADRAAKLRALRALAQQEESLLFAASDMTPRPAMRPFEPTADGHAERELESWVADRKRLWIATGGVAPSLGERARLASLKNRSTGGTIVIMGNGPSLNRIELDALRRVPTFAANRIYLAYERTDWRPTYYTALDWRVTPDNHREINQLTGSTFFFPNRFHGLLRGGDDVYWYHSVNRTDRWREQFQTDATRGVRGLGTVVTAMLQLAWHMGYRNFVLVGVDASYTVPATVEQSGPVAFATGNRLELTSTRDDDANHFDPRYFGAGKKWHDPNVEEMVRCFALCRKAIEALGGRIVNATPGGKLEVFERVDLDAELGFPAIRTEQATADENSPSNSDR